MNKTIDLNNTWCYVTEENYEALKSLGLTSVDYNSSDEIIAIQVRGKYSVFSSYTNIENNYWFKEYKQIRLVNGEFQFVEEKDTFNLNGFETPLFDGKIFMKSDGWFLGAVKYADFYYSAEWDSNGIATLSTNLISDAKKENIKFDLIPIKKEWYNYETNIGKLLTNGENIITFNRNHYEKWDGSLICEGYRPILKEEILKLIMEEI